jgi:hypothetical protein
MMNNYNTGIAHRPPSENKGEWIGVEIECFIPYRKLGGTHKEEYDEDRLYSYADAKRRLAMMLAKARIPNVTLKADGSIESPDDMEYFEIEINLLFSRKDYGPLRRLCTLLKRLNADVNESCGLHVHLDCRDLGVTLKSKTNEFFDSMVNLWRIEKVYSGKTFEEVMKRGKRFEKALPLMLNIVAPDRPDTGYCDPVMTQINKGDRHSAINLRAYAEHKTIEIRLHEGILDYEKIKNWIEFLYLISRSKIETKMETLADFANEVPRAPKSVVKYLKENLRRAS